MQEHDNESLYRIVGVMLFVLSFVLLFTQNDPTINGMALSMIAMLFVALIVWVYRNE